MSNSRQPSSVELNDRLEAYLDGLMSVEQAAEFQRIVAGDPLLQQEIELQQGIDNSLGRLFEAPAAPPCDILALAQQQPAPTDQQVVAERASAEPQPARTKNNARMWMIVIAASIAWVFAGVKLYDASTDDGYQEVALADIYEQCVDDGFQPKWVCDDDREFAETFLKRQGQPLLLKADSKNLMVGLAYLKGVSAKTTTMLAKVDGEPVLVFVDKLSRDTEPAKPSWGSGLNLYRQELDGLVLYELSPLDESRVLSSFYIPDELIPDELPEATNDGEESL